MNLTKTSATFRRSVNIGLLLLVLYIGFKASAPFAKSLYLKLNPPKNPPTIAYGMLDPLEFTEKETTGTIREVVLNTTSGRLPTLPTQLPVYKYEKLGFSYQAGKDAQDHARKLGFTDDEQITDLKGNLFSWKDKQTGAVLEIEIHTKELRVQTNLANFQSLFVPGKITAAGAESQARSVLGSINRLDNVQYSREKGRVSLAKFASGKLVKANSPLEAQLARVDFFRKVRDYPIVGPDPKKGLLSVVVGVSIGSGAPAVLSHPIIDFHDWPLIEDERGTYPLITVQEAWNAVANEKQGVIASVIPTDDSVFAEKPTPPRVDTVLINNIYLAYFDTEKRQNFMQPIYVFEGDYNVGGKPGGEITLYFPAVQGQYVKPVPQENTQTQ